MTFIIPYRNRSEHLAQFLKHYRRLFPHAYFLVVEQSWEGQFNRAKLFNVGILEQPSDYYIFHDVDMLVQGVPDYSPDHKCAVHLATNASQFGNKMPFEEYFGGAVVMTKKQLQKCNGWPNRFFGYGGEDNEMYLNILECGLKVVHREHRMLSLPHPKHPIGYVEDKMKMAMEERPVDDGLNNTQYTLLNTLEFSQGRKITVKI